MPTSRSAVRSLLLLSALCGPLLLALPAAAAERERAAERADRRQAVAEKGVKREVTRGGGEVQATVTGPDGKSATRSTSRENGDKSTSVTGSDGKTAERSVDRDADGRTISVAGPDGKASTRTVERGSRRERLEAARAKASGN